MARGYRVLDPGEERLQCSFILVNKMQCWQLGSEEVTDLTINPGNEQVKLVYQLCERHTRIQQAIDTGQLPTTESGSPLEIPENKRERMMESLASQILN